MKNMKKLGALLLVVVMVLGLMMTSAFAAEAPKTYTLTINDASSDHEYAAYQIFKGDVSGQEDANQEQGFVLSNIQWGDGVNSANLLAALKASNAFGDPNAFANATTAQDVAEVLDGQAFDSAMAQAFADLVGANLSDTVSGTSTYSDGKHTISGLTGGYYFVKDANNLDGENDAYTRFMMEIVGDANATRKSDVPSVEKKVQDNDSTAWQDSADHDIGDDVRFQLTGTLPSNYADYETYKYVFHDKLSDGLTYNEGSVTVFVEDSQGNRFPVTSGYTVTNEDGELTITFDNLKGISPAPTSSAKIVVEYTAKLNENAQVNENGNSNEVTLEFSNDPNWNGEGEEPTGETEKDVVIVFTYELDVTKQYNGDAPAVGDEAKFTLSKKNAAGEYEVVKFSFDEENGVYYVDPNGTITELSATDLVNYKMKGLDDGEYKLEETHVPEGYNKAADIEFTITATHDTDSADPKLTDLEINVDGFNVAGYTYDEATGETTKTGTVTGMITTTIENNTGSRLPSTGGIGTTIFYIVGGILVVAAGVLLITKSRMKREG